MGKTVSRTASVFFVIDNLVSLFKFAKLRCLRADLYKFYPNEWTECLPESLQMLIKGLL